MKLGIMQPYFFPYLGYYHLISATEHFVFFDIPQYEKRSWMNRNRIINLKEGSTFITVPTVKAPQQTAICDMKIDYSQNWEIKIINQLDVYKKRAEFFDDALGVVEKVLSRKYNSIAELNISSVVETCRYIGIPFDFDVFSQMKLGVPQTCPPDEWALNIAKELGYDEYVNAPGGMSFFSKEKYDNEGIKLYFVQPRLEPYVQRIGRFESGLSIVDVMMFNSPEKIGEMLKEYSLI